MAGQDSKKFKVAIIGDPMVGKTSVVKKFVLDEFEDDYLLTLGAKVMTKEVEIPVPATGETHNVMFMIWDMMGQKHFKIIESVVFENVKGAIVVCDYTRQRSMENLEYWIEAMFSITGKIPVVIVANKSDLKDDAQFSAEEVQKVAWKYNAVAIDTSAKTGQNLDEVFRKLGEIMLTVGV